jgi:hypothetical protein
MVNLFYHARYINLITFANTNLNFGLGDLSSSKFNAASKVYVNLRNIPIGCWIKTLRLTGCK